jgi:glutamate/aspartate transport system permease protein
MKYNWNWNIFWELSPDAIHTYGALLLNGLAWTIGLSALAWVIALTTGAIIGVMRTLPGKLPQTVASLWIEFFRNIPILVQLFLWYFVLPELLPKAAGTWLKQLPNASFWTGVIGVGLFMSARFAVQIRAGIQSLPRGQSLAAKALGLTTWQTYAHVLLPAALRIVLPPLSSETINVVKNSSVALTIGVMELTARAREMQEFSFQVFEAFTAATLLYLALNLVITQALRFVERKVAIPGYLQGK